MLKPRRSAGNWGRRRSIFYIENRWFPIISRSGCNFSSLLRWGFCILGSVKNPWGFLSHRRGIREPRTLPVCHNNGMDVYNRAFYSPFSHFSRSLRDWVLKASNARVSLLHCSWDWWNTRPINSSLNLRSSGNRLSAYRYFT